MHGGRSNSGNEIDNLPPNFVLMLLDDHGYGDVGVYNPSFTTETPHMDKLAAGGIRFTDFHSAASLCTPSRAALLTGRLGLRTGVPTNFGPRSIGGLPMQERTIAELLPSYKNHMIGKWHLGHKEPHHHPSFRGFDTVYGLPYSGDMGCLDMAPQSCKPGVNRSIGTPECPALCNSKDNEVGVPLYNVQSPHCTSMNALRNQHENHTKRPTSCDDLIAEQPVNEFTLNQRYAQQAENIVADAATSTSPFFLYIGFAHTHTPMAYDEANWGNASKRSGWNRHYGNTLAEVDDAVGGIVTALEKHGLTNNTLLWLTSDNGPADVSLVDCDFIGSPGPFQGLWQKSLSGGGGGGVMKATLWEGGHRVVSIASWPGTIKAGRVSNDLTSSLDILPTFLSLARVLLPRDRSFDGLDLSPLLTNASVNMSQLLQRKVQSRNNSLQPNFDASMAVDLGQKRDDIIGWQRVLFHPSILDHGRLSAMRVGRYKLMFETGGTEGCHADDSGGPKKHHMPPLVFDVLSDPSESTPLPNLDNMLLGKALKARDEKLRDIHTTMSHEANMQDGTKLDSACCNRNSNVCRCPWQEWTLR